MKNLKINYLLIALLSFGLLFTACSSNSSDVNTEESSELGKEFTSPYVCTMHCEGSGSEEAGNCPICGMEYVKNEAHSIYACPMHPEITGEKGDKCSICGMELTPVEGDDHEGHNH